MNKNAVPFRAADILIPRHGLEKWSTVACDQFTSEPEYWEAAADFVGDAPSALKVTLPEIYLSDNPAARISAINNAMREYLDDGVFAEYPDSMIYLERTLPDGGVRRGIIGAVDLEAYDYAKSSDSLIRATEGTVLERIPPRVKIRSGAPLELPHVMLLIDDPGRTVIEPEQSDEAKEKAYDFELMAGGGRARGWCLGKEAIERITESLAKLGSGEHPLLFAVGDLNHSLATAKACYLANPTPKNRFALVEIVNIHDEALRFEPIYRVLFGVDPDCVVEALSKLSSDAPGAQEIVCVMGENERSLKLSPTSALPVGTLQNFIDAYLAAHPNAKVDYIHGEEVTRKLANGENTVGFIFAGMNKSELFPAVIRDGALPRKTFSMGEAASKRYYLEVRRIETMG